MDSMSCKNALAIHCERFVDEIIQWFGPLSIEEVPYYCDPKNWVRESKRTTDGRTTRKFICGETGRVLQGVVHNVGALFSLNIAPY